MNDRGVLLVLSGPSGSGKSTIAHRLLAEVPDLAFSVSATTRPPRPGEGNGRDYHFLSERDFLARVRAGEFLEHAEVYGRRYGTLRSEVDQRLARGQSVLLDVDTQGAASVRALGLPHLSVFIRPPDIEALRRRLERRGQDSPEAIARRLAEAERELAQAGLYDHVVVNDDLERALARVREILEDARSSKA